MNFAARLPQSAPPRLYRIGWPQPSPGSHQVSELPCHRLRGLDHRSIDQGHAVGLDVRRRPEMRHRAINAERAKLSTSSPYRVDGQFRAF
jgi:hypothetical protein